jgi:AcrR family transcriptional regulator
LVAAAREELKDVGFADMTIRTVAARAAVAPATAYTYFSSKNHLVAEIFWRTLSDRPRLTSRKTSPYARVVEVFQDLAALVAEDPELSAAVTVALLNEEPDVKHLRVLIGAEINDRIVAAYGDKPSADILDALSLAWSGAMLQVGMGHAAADEMGDRLARVARLLMRP